MANETEVVNAKIERMKAIEAQARVRCEQRELQVLDTSHGVQRYLAKKDGVVLDTILAQLNMAYDKELNIGYKFSENVEKIIAIIFGLQFAKREVRELLQPSANSNNIDLYKVFDRSLRDMVVDSYGQLPYFREETKLEMPDGKIQVLDTLAVKRAEEGRKADIEMLNVAVQEIALALDLLGEYAVTQEEEDRAWTQATERLYTAKQLQAVQEHLS